MSEFEVEVVFALRDKQSLRVVSVMPGATVADVVSTSGLNDEFADQGIGELALGIWGRKVSSTHPVKAGDRVEIYRVLELDPKEARRQLALSGRTMSSADRG